MRRGQFSLSRAARVGDLHGLVDCAGELGLRSYGTGRYSRLHSFILLLEELTSGVAESRMQPDASSKYKQRAVQHQRDVVDCVGQGSRAPLKDCLGQRIMLCVIEDLGSRCLSCERCAAFTPNTLPMPPDTFATYDLFESSWNLALYRADGNARDKHVTDLAGDPSFTAKELAVQDDPCSHASPDRQKYEVIETPRYACMIFAECGHVDVVVDKGGHAERGFKQIAQGHVRPSHQVRRCEDDSLLCIGDAGSARGNRAKVRARRQLLFEQRIHALANQAHDEVRIANAYGGCGPSSYDRCGHACQRQAKAGSTYVHAGDEALAR